MSALNIALLGLGTVGRGTAALLARNADEIARRTGRPVRLAGVLVRDAARARAALVELGLAEVAVTTAGETLVDDPAIDLVCELIGGEEPAHALVRRALERDKHVVTANKALIAKHGDGLFALARERRVALACEAAVAGGVPIVKALREGLAANRIEWLAGIINGTANFVLSEMAHAGRDFDEVLAEAQRLGYAEADPSFDIDGVDAAHKLAILAAIAFDMPLALEAVHVEGIREIEADDVAFAAELGYRVKHLGIARRRADGVELRVHPALVPERRLIANVDGVLNAVLVQGDAAGPTLYHGAGAGAAPTASAVVADIVDVARGFGADGARTARPMPGASPPPTLARDEFESAFYLRLFAEDRPGVLAEISGIFGALGISIEAILQKEPETLPEDDAAEPPRVPLILLSRRVREGLIREAVRRIDALPAIEGRVRMLRVESLG